MNTWEDPPTPLTSHTKRCILNPAIFVFSPFVHHLHSHIFAVHPSVPRPRWLSAADVPFAVICRPITPGTGMPHAGMTAEGAFPKSFWIYPVYPSGEELTKALGKMRQKPIGRLGEWSVVFGAAQSDLLLPIWPRGRREFAGARGFLLLRVATCAIGRSAPLCLP